MFRKKKRNEYKPEERGGIVVKFDDRNQSYYHESDTKHALVEGGTGTGKTKRIFIPSIYTMIRNKDCFVVNDTKKELYYTFKKYLETQDYDIILLDYRNTDYGQRFNFMDDIIRYIKEGKEDSAQMEAEDLASTLVPKPKGSDPIWSDGAKSIISSTMLAIAKDKAINESAKNISNVFNNIIQLGVQTGEETLLDIYFNDNARSEVEKMSYGNYGMSSSKVRMSFNTVATSALREFTYEKIARQTAKSDFNIREYANNTIDRPVAIFVVNPDEKETAERLATTFIEATRRKLVEEASKLKGQKLKRRWFFVLDEFTNMGELPNFSKRLTVDRGRNIIYLLGVQSGSQLDATYGKENAITIRKNTSIKIWLEAAQENDVKALQDEAGYTTVVGASPSRKQGSLFNFTSSNDSISYTSKKVPLLSNEFLTNMKTPDAVVKKSGMYAFKTYLPIFFDTKLNEILEMSSFENEIARDETNKSRKDYWQLLPVKNKKQEQVKTSKNSESNKHVEETVVSESYVRPNYNDKTKARKKNQWNNTKDEQVNEGSVS